MEKQELLDAWTEMQSRVEKLTTLQLASQNQVVQIQTEKVRNRTRRSPIWDILIASVTLLVVGNFVADHFVGILKAPITVFPAAILFATSIFFLNMSIRQLILSSDLDYGRAIVETQTQLAKLRKLRLQSTQGAFILGLPLWVVFPILLGQMLFGINFIFALNPAWVIGNIAFGLAMIPVINWALKKSPYTASVQDCLVGKDVVEAESFLREIERFQLG